MFSMDTKIPVSDGKDDNGTVRFQFVTDGLELEVVPKQAKEGLLIAAPFSAASTDSKLPRNRKALNMEKNQS